MVDLTDLERAAIRAAMKPVAEIMTAGHGSPFIAQVSIANSAKLYKALIDGLEYRGTAFFQCYTTCQPEHGVGDDASEQQSRLAVESRAYPLFRYDPDAGADVKQAISLEGNPAPDAPSTPEGGGEG